MARHRSRITQPGYRKGQPNANRGKRYYAETYSRAEIQAMVGALLRRFAVIEITSEPVWMSAGPSAAVGVAVQSLPVRLA